MGTMAQIMVAMRSAMGGGSCRPMPTAPLRTWFIMVWSTSMRRRIQAKGCRFVLLEINIM